MTWLDAIFPAPAVESTRRVVVRRRLSPPKVFARTKDVPPAMVEAVPGYQVVSPLLHAPNAP